VQSARVGAAPSCLSRSALEQSVERGSAACSSSACRCQAKAQHHDPTHSSFFEGRLFAGADTELPPDESLPLPDPPLLLLLDDDEEDEEEEEEEEEPDEEVDESESESESEEDEESSDDDDEDDDEDEEESATFLLRFLPAFRSSFSFLSPSFS
jgi:hypothetical protein